MAYVVFAVLSLFLACAHGKGALRGMFPDPLPMKKTGVDPGEPLFLSPYLKKGQPEVGKTSKSADNALISDLIGKAV
jgi:hypothetical protein